ncbi:hypothetical protein NEOLEDRAFT_1072823 [Neolentinus lepideus HHB14362 ss-1]|uniref:Uncharacterized protein n=1 Tax=Neolentinus lepideus HHB14362 ss-1 TaxID=1314782 RepID=A0A165Q3T8_9AGAM|nr:hypothetical protein NEOLEDRAFT_1072823 [Neolentinus lepideus HHB14362 ss-1]
MNSWTNVLRRLAVVFRPRSEEDYELLPPNGAPAGVSRKRRRSARGLLYACLHLFTFRRIAITLVSIPVLLAMAVLWSGVPPSYEDIRVFERNLPQHNVSLAVSARRGHEPKYLRFPGHLWGHGLNNILQETILMSQLAYLSNRSYVFEDYVWSMLPFPYTIYDFALRPTRMPINAFISGPSAGGPMSGPPAVSSKFWDSICPKEKRRIITSEGSPLSGVKGSVLMDWWVERLQDVDDSCVEIDQDSLKNPIFDRYLFGSSQILSLWPDLSSSPILTDFMWSPLVQSAILRNFALLQPASVKALYSEGTLPGLVAIHLRRGDFKRHCARLSNWGSIYMGFNQFPLLPDKFNPAPYNNTADSRLQYYFEHCLPETEQIVARLHAVRAQHPSLNRVYLLTNGWGWWLNALKDALRKDGWADATSSLDIQLDAEQSYVGMAVDMAIAEKAEVFIGNGFSSLSSNIVMLRMAKGLAPASNRFL